MPKLVAYFQWWADTRDIDGDGLVSDVFYAHVSSFLSLDLFLLRIMMMTITAFSMIE